MQKLEGWGFLCLIGCLVAIALSMFVLEGTGRLIGCGIGVFLGILSGGLYAASVTKRSCAEAGPGAAPTRR
jgi:hypothetical protein